MRKKNFSKPLVLVAAIFLAACTAPKQQNSSVCETECSENDSLPPTSEPAVSSSQAGETPESSQPLPSSVPHGTQTADGFSLADISGEQVLINPKAKLYVDAMREQEKTLQYEYRVSPLYGPEDFNHNGSDKPDGVTYSDAEKGGVDVVDYLNRTDYNDMTPAMPVKIEWTKGSLQYVNATIEYWPKGRESEKLSKSTTSNSVEIDNLYSNTEYEYRLITDYDANWKSATKSFKTADYPRPINLGTLRNVRDCGGYMTSYGKRTKQGLVYRGPEINSKQIQSFNDPRPANYTEEVQRVQDEVLHIGVQLDLKGANDNDLGNSSRTKSALEPADYVNAPSTSYENYLNSQTSDANIKKTFNLFANADQKHVYFHCQGGADRTGVVAFFLNAICGVSFTDLIIDFELTTQSNNKRSHMHNSTYSHMPRFLYNWTHMSCYDANKSVNENAVAYLMTRGVTMETIEKIRSVMIDGYQTGDTENLHETETYNTAVYQYDSMGHWNPSNTPNSPKKGNYHKHASNAACATCGYDGQGGSSTGGNTGGEEEHTHTWTNESTHANQGESEFVIKKCDCGQRAVVVDALKYTSSGTDSSKPFGNSDSAGATFKMKNNGNWAEYKFTAGYGMQNAEVYFYGYVDHYDDSNNNKDKGFYVNNNVNIELTLNEATLSIGNHQTYAEMGMAKGENGNGAFTLCSLGTITSLSAGLNTLRYKRLGSYNLNITEIWFVGNFA